jgi:cation diffusion facilitator CzcD-associated flavoprotein CzcO
MRRQVASLLLLIRLEPALVAPVVTQPEILAYFERCADDYGLRLHLQLRSEIRSARWDDDSQRWCLTTAR